MISMVPVNTSILPTTSTGSSPSGSPTEDATSQSSATASTGNETPSSAPSETTNAVRANTAGQETQGGSTSTNTPGADATKAAAAAPARQTEEPGFDVAALVDGFAQAGGAEDQEIAQARDAALAAQAQARFEVIASRLEAAPDSATIEILEDGAEIAAAPRDPEEQAKADRATTAYAEAADAMSPQAPAQVDATA